MIDDEAPAGFVNISTTISETETNALSALVGKGKEKVGVSDTHLLSQSLESLSGNEGKGREKIYEGKETEKLDEGTANCISQDLVPKFSLTELDNEVEMLAPPIDKIITSVKRGSLSEDANEDPNLPLKPLKREIKIEKI